MGPTIAVPDESNDLRVVLFPHNDSIRAFMGMIPDDRLNPGDPGTRGINDGEAGSFESLALLGGYAMGPDDHCTAF